MWKQELQQAIDTCGGQRPLADALSAVMRKRVSPQLVSYWLNRATRMEADYCLPLQYVTAGAVKASAFRPDVFRADVFDDMPREKLIEQIETLESPARANG